LKKCGAKRSPTARRLGSRPGTPPIRIRLLAVGRLRKGPFAELQALYAGRIAPAVAIVDIEVRQRLPAAVLKTREAELILAALPPGAHLVALDEHGALWTSRDLADRLAAWRDQGVTDLVFAIGGADGLDARILDRAAATLSLGRMTWPHLLVRGMLLEQLYRAQQILAGHPYHRD
jgi:23S rRNA (pseudouridine1915-N3)-methyltransferase